MPPSMSCEKYTCAAAGAAQHVLQAGYSFREYWHLSSTGLLHAQALAMDNGWLQLCHSVSNPWCTDN